MEKQLVGQKRSSSFHVFRPYIKKNLLSKKPIGRLLKIVGARWGIITSRKSTNIYIYVYIFGMLYSVITRKLSLFTFCEHD